MAFFFGCEPVLEAPNDGFVGEVRFIYFRDAEFKGFGRIKMPSFELHTFGIGGEEAEVVVAMKRKMQGTCTQLRVGWVEAEAV